MRMSTTKTDVTKKQRERLVSLAAWAAGEDAKRRLGLDSEWDQDVWISQSCGTTCCIAGKVALEDGAIPVAYDDELGTLGREDSLRAWNQGRGVDTAGRVYPPGSEQAMYLDGYAAEVLGLDAEQSERLFSGDNDLEDVLEIVADILGLTLGD